MQDTLNDSPIVYYTMYDDDVVLDGDRAVFFPRWRPGDLDKAGASSCASSSSSFAGSCFEPRVTRENASRLMSVRLGNDRRMWSALNRGQRRKNLFREKLTSSGRVSPRVSAPDLPLLSHFSRLLRRRKSRLRSFRDAITKSADMITASPRECIPRMLHGTRRASLQFAIR